VVNLKRHVIDLLYRYELATVVVVIWGRDNHVLRLGEKVPRWWHDGDHVGVLEMDNKGAKKGYTMSDIFMHVMFVPFYASNFS
jgi:hypothetical protein